MKTIVAGCVTGCGVALAAAAVAVFSPVAAQQSPVGPGDTVMSFYDLKTMTLAGAPADLGEYEGTVSLVVNVASKCGYTPQYEGLEQLQREMKGKGFNVLGFPSNDFGGQEPGSAQENRRLLPAHLRRDVPDVRESRHEEGRGPVARLRLPWRVRQLAGVEL